MASFLDVCRFTPTLGGTTDWTVSTAVTGYQTPAAAGAVNGAIYRYRAESADLSQWEIGYGAYTVAGTVLARTTVLFNSSGGTSKITFSTVPQVAIVALAEDLLNLVLSLNGQVGALVNYSPPQGRLTLTSGTAVPSASVAGATTVYYTPAVGPQTQIYDGTNFIPYSIAEISQATTDTTKSPAAVAASSLYDVFVWNDAGTIRATRGPAWTSGTARSAGTALVLVSGIYLNNASITNGPAAQRGTYVGTIASNGSSTIDFIFGGSSAGGTAAVFNVWNLYNQVLFSTQVLDTTASWTYHLGARSLNGSNTNRITFVSGLPIHSILAKYSGSAQSPAVAGALYNMSFGFDSTGGAYRPGLAGSGAAAATLIGFASIGYIPPQTGSHFIQAIESGDGTNNFTVTGGSSFQGGLEAGIWA